MKLSSIWQKIRGWLPPQPSTSSKLRHHSAPIAIGFAIALCSLTFFVVYSNFLIQSSAVPAPISGDSSEETSTKAHFNIDICYAYVGPNTNVPIYDGKPGETWIPTFKYASAVYLNFSRLPQTSVTDCDALLEVYGIKIAADTGPSELYAYSFGAPYDNSNYSKSDPQILFSHIGSLANDTYGSYMADFKGNWTLTPYFLSPCLGSIGDYTGSHSPTSSGLYKAGIPNAISVTVYRLGYITVSHGEVSVFNDSGTTNTIASVQLEKYGDGFLHNNLVPQSELRQIDLFNPPQAGLAPEPYVPEFTLQFLNVVDHADNGVYVPQAAPWVTIKNQVVPAYKDSNGLAVNLYFNYRWKSHDSNDWNTYSPDDSYVIAARFFTITNSSIYPNTPCTIFPIPQIRFGGQFDVQFKALIGNIENGKGQTPSPDFAGLSPIGYNFVGQQSDWSPTQTITIPASSTSPTISSTISPNEEGFTVSVPLIAALGIVAVLVVLAGSLLLFRRRRKISKPQTA